MGPVPSGMGDFNIQMYSDEIKTLARKLAKLRLGKSNATRATEDCCIFAIEVSKEVKSKSVINEVKKAWARKKTCSSSFGPTSLKATIKRGEDLNVQISIRLKE